MYIVKDITSPKGACITLDNQFGDVLQIYYVGDYLFFEINNYKPENNFYVTGQNDMYNSLIKLFSNLKKSDTLHFMPCGRNANRFEWIGEGIGIPEMRDRMVIDQKGEFFKLHFDKSKFNKSNICRVGFSLNDSNYPEIVKIFNEMFIDAFKNPLPAKKKILSIMR